MRVRRTIYAGMTGLVLMVACAPEATTEPAPTPVFSSTELPGEQVGELTGEPSADEQADLMLALLDSTDVLYPEPGWVGYMATMTCVRQHEGQSQAQTAAWSRTEFPEWSVREAALFAAFATSVYCPQFL